MHITNYIIYGKYCAFESRGKIKQLTETEFEIWEIFPL